VNQVDCFYVVILFVPAYFFWNDSILGKRNDHIYWVVNEFMHVFIFKLFMHYAADGLF
jgi:hypothetical protein